MRKKSRILAVFIVFCMVLTLIPMNAVATSEHGHAIQIELLKDTTTFNNNSVLHVDFKYKSGTDVPVAQSIYLKYDATKLYPVAAAKGTDASTVANDFSVDRGGIFTKNNYEIEGEFGTESSEVKLYTIIKDGYGYINWVVTEPQGTSAFSDFTRISSIFFGLKEGVAFDTLPKDAIKLATVTDDKAVTAQVQSISISTGTDTLVYGSKDTDTLDVDLASLFVAGNGVTFVKPEYTGTEANAPTVSQKNGGNVVLMPQTAIENEKVEYAYGVSGDKPTSGWQDSNIFNQLPAGEYYFFARVKEDGDHKAGKSAVSEKVTVYAKPQIISYSNTEQIIVVDSPITAMVPAVSGGAQVSGYSITGTLPQGLIFDESTGVISGTPEVTSESATAVEVTVKDTEDITSEAFSVVIPAVNKKENTMNSVAQGDVIYNGANSLVNPEAASNGAVPVFKYKVFGANDSTYTVTKPTKVGKYTVKAVSQGHAKVKDKEVTADFEILKKTLAVDYSGITAVVKAYDGTTAAGTITGQATVTGISGDEVGIETVAGEYSSETAGINKNITLTFKLTGKDAGNYQLENETYNFDKAKITAIAPTYQVPVSKEIKVGSGLSVFEDVAPESATGVKNEEVRGSVSWYSDADRNKPATADDVNLGVDGSVTLYWVFTPASENYTAVSGQTTFKIVNGDPQNIRFIKSAIEKTYGDKNFTNEITGRVEGGGALTWESSNEDVAAVDNKGEVTIKSVGSVTITATAAAVPGKYAEGKDSYTLNVGQKEVTPSIKCSNSTKEYDGTTTVTGASIDLEGIIGQDDVSATAKFAYDTKNTDAKLIKATSIELTGDKAVNYRLSANQIQTSGTITAKALNINDVTVTDREYDGTDKVVLNGGSLVGVIGSEDVSFNLGQGIAASADAGENIDVITDIKLVGADAGNYKLVQPESLTVTITAKAITISGVKAVSRTYDGTETVELEGGTLNGLCGDDKVSFDLGKSTLENKNVGTDKPVTANIALTGDKAGNYTLTQPTSLRAAVTAKELTVEGAKATDREYDGTVNVAITEGRLKGTIAGDDIQLNSSAVVGKIADAGIGENKVVIVTGYALSGTDSTNYSLIQPTDVKVTISKKALTIKSVTVENKKYDGKVDATVKELVFNENPAPALNTGCIATAVFKDENVGTAKQVIVKVTLNDKNYSLTNDTIETTAAITKADAWNIPAQKVILKAGDKTVQKVDLNGLMPDNAGTLNYEDPVLTGDEIIDTAKATFENGVYSFELKDEAVANKTQTIKFKISSDNYADTDITVEVKTTDKEVPTVTIEDITVEYTGNEVAKDLIKGTSSVEGNFDWATGVTAPRTVADSGIYEVVFIPADDSYETVTKTIRVTITPAKVSGSIEFTKVTSAGHTLADIKPTNFNKLSQSGTFVWDDGDAQVIEQGKPYRWTFTPNDENYAVLRGTVTPWADANNGGGGGGGFIPPTAEKPEITVDNAQGKVVLSADGTTATITPNDGYEIEKVTVNGKEVTAINNKITGLKAGDKVVVTFKEKAAPEPEFDVQKYVSKLKIVARSSKTAKKNIRVKVTSVTDQNGKAVNLTELKDKGYTVKYKFYRSTKKSSKYATKVEKAIDTNSYINKAGKKGAKYFYKVRVMVYDNDGKLIAKSALKQCKYASRTWTKK